MGNRSSVSRSGETLIKRRTLRIGVIADTHGLYDPAIERHFAGVGEILHAGDIGDNEVIRCLRRLAPVTAVSGNVDDYEASGFPRRRLLKRKGLRIGLCHILYDEGKMAPEAKAWLDRVRPDVCVFGHSHRPTLAHHGRTLLFNPGSAGPRRFSLPRGIGILTVESGRTTPTLIRLNDRVAASLSSSRPSVRAKGVSS
jgi:putative phosphoesterase